MLPGEDLAALPWQPGLARFLQAMTDFAGRSFNPSLFLNRKPLLLSEEGSCPFNTRARKLYSGSERFASTRAAHKDTALLAPW